MHGVVSSKCKLAWRIFYTGQNRRRNRRKKKERVGRIAGALKSSEDGEGQKKRSYCPETSRPNQDGVVNDRGRSRGLGDNLGQAQLSNCSLLAAEAPPTLAPPRSHPFRKWKSNQIWGLAAQKAASFISSTFARLVTRSLRARRSCARVD